MLVSVVVQKRNEEEPKLALRASADDDVEEFCEYAVNKEKEGVQKGKQNIAKME